MRLAAASVPFATGAVVAIVAASVPFAALTATRIGGAIAVSAIIIIIVIVIMMATTAFGADGFRDDQRGDTCNKDAHQGDPRLRRRERHPATLNGLKRHDLSLALGSCAYFSRPASLALAPVTAIS